MKKLFKFKGGIHPPENKYTSTFPVENAVLPEKVVLPLVQHIGSPAKPLVTVGENVLTGQKIAEAGGFVSAPIHATISGKVAGIIPWLHPVLNRKIDSIIIESDGKDSVHNPDKILTDYYRYSKKELISKICDAGIVGLGGATFPTHVKLSPPENMEISTVIINGAECEPYLTSDDRLMQEHPKDIIEGTKILMFILNASKAIVAVEENKAEAIKILKEIIYNEPNIDIAVLPVHYPQGSEKHLIKTLTGKEVPSGKLPLDVGVIVNNVTTAHAVSRVIRNGENLISRIITVTGRGISVSKNLKVRLGTLVTDIALQCGGVTAGLAQVIMGGPMMGVAQSTLDVPVIKGTSGILFLSSSEAVNKDYSDCFKCGKCVKVCPMRLLPNSISICVERGNISDTKVYNPLDCMECGSCVYVCPANRPIVHQIKWAKLEIGKKK